jgi:hypothetical protein
LKPFFDEDAFEAGFERELALAEDVEQRIREGQPAFVMRTFDVTFVSNAREKLAALVKDLAGYQFGKVEKANRLWEVSGTSMPVRCRALASLGSSATTKSGARPAESNGLSAVSTATRTTRDRYGRRSSILRFSEGPAAASTIGTRG